MMKAYHIACIVLAVVLCISSYAKAATVTAGEQFVADESDNINNSNEATTRLRGGVTKTTTLSDRRKLQGGKVGKVIRLRVISANDDDTNGKRLIDPLNNNTIINLKRFPTGQFFNIEVVVDTVSGPIGSVGLTLQSGSSSELYLRKEDTAPYSLCGDSNGTGRFNRCLNLVPSRSTYTITATPYELVKLQGKAGATRTYMFTVVDERSPPPPVPLPITPPAPKPVAPPVKIPVVAPVPIPVKAPIRTPVAAPVRAAPAWKEVDNDAPINKRHEACFVMVGRKAYLLAGRGLNPVNIYDPIQRTWTNGASPPISIHHTQCVVVDTSIWIVSSWTGGYPLERNNDLIYVYDTVNDNWYMKIGLPEARRRGSAAAVLVGRRIYVSHGNRGGHETGNHATTLGWLDYYDVDEDRWYTNLPDAPNPRDHAGGGLVNGRICVAGGRDGGDVDFFQKTILPTDCYDPVQNRWYVEANIPEGRAGSSYGTTCDGKLMIAGGEGGSKAAKKQAWANVDVFDGTSWTSIPSLNTPRHGSGLAFDCICNQIHIAGGATTQGGRSETKAVETSGIDVPCRF